MLVHKPSTRFLVHDNWRLEVETAYQLTGTALELKTSNFPQQGRASIVPA